VHLCFAFSLWSQMASQQSTKFRTAFFCQFRTSLWNDSVVNYESIWTQFLKSVPREDVLSNALNIRRYLCRWRHKIWKIAVEILQSVNNRKQNMRKILRMVITDIVINTFLVVTRHPAGMHCPAGDDAFVSSYRQDAAKRQTACIKFTLRPKIRFFAP